MLRDLTNSIGHWGLFVALVCAAWSVVAALLGARVRGRGLQLSAERAVLATFGLLSLGATCLVAGFLADGQYARAAALCRHSLKLNRGHTPTHRVLAISEMLGGRAEAAHAAVEALRALEPRLTVSQYLDRDPGGPAPHARVYARALQEAGLPH